MRSALLVLLLTTGCDYFPEALLHVDLGQDARPDAVLDLEQGQDSPRPDSLDPDAVKPDALKPDALKPDTLKPDTLKPDTLKPDAPVDGPAPDAPPADTGQPDAAPDSGSVAPGTWVKIPAGGFSMGSPTSEPCRGSSNETQHTVNLTRPFWISTTEVTQTQFLSVMSYNPASKTACGSSCPVESVSWHQAAAYCNALSALDKRAACYSCSGSGTSVSCAAASSYSLGKIYDCPGFRLPTDAEWEYAYRAKTTTALHNGPISGCKTDSNLAKIAWYSGNAGGTTRPVAGKAANAWGLYDMAGNVFEWCHDVYVTDLGGGAATDPYGATSGSAHVLRSGGWGYPSEAMRAAYRSPNSGGVKAQFKGLRCVRTAKP
jgi:formylglycine-generating enzyme required for sulfatase activity